MKRNQANIVARGPASRLQQQKRPIASAKQPAASKTTSGGVANQGEGQKKAADRKGQPLAMSMSLKADPNEVPSMHTHCKQAERVRKYVQMVKEQIKGEIELCIQDQLNLNQGMQGILDYEKEQLGNIDRHFQQIGLQIEKAKERLQNEIKAKIAQMKDRQQKYIGIAKENQNQLEHEERGLDGYAAASGGRLSLSVDLSELALALKAQQKSIVDKSKELRNLRRTVLYQPNDYYLFEPPAFDSAAPPVESQSKEHDQKAHSETVGQLQTPGPKIDDKSSYLEQLDKFLRSQLLPLNIYGQIKTICPSEFFMCDVLGKGSSFKTTHLIKIDKNTSEGTYSVDVSPLSSSTKQSHLFVRHQAHIWIPDEQKFMFVGGKNAGRQNIPLKSSFLFSIFNPEDVENLEDIRLRREQSSLCLMNGVPELNKKYDSKVLAVGGLSSPSSGEYQSTCEIFDLQLDIWKSTAKLKIDRLSPFVISLGCESALVIGGVQANHITLQKRLIREAEIIDTKQKLSYMPSSKCKLPDDVREVLGLFKLSQEVKSQAARNEWTSRDSDVLLDEVGNTPRRNRQDDHQPAAPFFGEGSPSIGQRSQQPQDASDPRGPETHGLSGSKAKSNLDGIDVLIEHVVVLYLNNKDTLRAQFLESQTLIDKNDQDTNAFKDRRHTQPLAEIKNQEQLMASFGRQSKPPSRISLAVVPHTPDDIKMLDEVNRRLRSNTTTRQKIVQICQSTTNPSQLFIVAQLKNVGRLAEASRPSKAALIEKRRKLNKTVLATDLPKLSAKQSGWQVIDAPSDAPVRVEKADLKQLPKDDDGEFDCFSIEMKPPEWPLEIQGLGSAPSPLNQTVMDIAESKLDYMDDVAATPRKGSAHEERKQRPKIAFTQRLSKPDNRSQANAGQANEGSQAKTGEQPTRKYTEQVLEEDSAINNTCYTPRGKREVARFIKRPAVARVPLKSSLQVRSVRLDGRRSKKTVPARSSPENLYSDQSDDEPWQSQSAKKAEVEEQPAQSAKKLETNLKAESSTEQAPGAGGDSLFQLLTKHTSALKRNVQEFIRAPTPRKPVPPEKDLLQQEETTAKDSRTRKTRPLPPGASRTAAKDVTKSKGDDGAVMDLRDPLAPRRPNQDVARSDLHQVTQDEAVVGASSQRLYHPSSSKQYQTHCASAARLHKVVDFGRYPADEDSAANVVSASGRRMGRSIAESLEHNNQDDQRYATESSQLYKGDQDYVDEQAYSDEERQHAVGSKKLGPMMAPNSQSVAALFMKSRYAQMQPETAPAETKPQDNMPIQMSVGDNNRHLVGRETGPAADLGEAARNQNQPFADQDYTKFTGQHDQEQAPLQAAGMEDQTELPQEDQEQREYAEHLDGELEELMGRSREDLLDPDREADANDTPFAANAGGLDGNGGGYDVHGYPAAEEYSQPAHQDYNNSAYYNNYTGNYNNYGNCYGAQYAPFNASFGGSSATGGASKVSPNRAMRDTVRQSKAFVQLDLQEVPEAADDAAHPYSAGISQPAQGENEYGYPDDAGFAQGLVVRQPAAAQHLLRQPSRVVHNQSIEQELEEYIRQQSKHQR